MHPTLNAVFGAMQQSSVGNRTGDLSNQDRYFVMCSNPGFGDCGSSKVDDYFSLSVICLRMNMKLTILTYSPIILGKFKSNSHKFEQIKSIHKNCNRSLMCLLNLYMSALLKYCVTHGSSSFVDFCTLL